jgi:hypothetical protein
MANGDGSSGIAGVLVGALILIAAVLGFMYYNGSIGGGHSVNVQVKAPTTTPAPTTPTTPKSQ